MKNNTWLLLGIIVGGLAMFTILWFTSKKATTIAATQPANAIGFVEIPLSDTAKGKAFYTSLFQVQLSPRVVDSLHMYFFPMNTAGYGSAVALVYGKTYEPSKTGAVVYFTVKNIEASVQKALGLGASLNYPITQVDGTMKVAEIIDPLGNRIGLQQP